MNTKNTQIAKLTLMASLVGGVNAAVIVQDTFSRDGLLHNSVADTGQTWSQPAATFTTTGGVLNTSNSQAAVIGGLNFLPNATYVLSMDLGLDNANNWWVGVGFGTQHTNSTAFMIHEQGNAGLFQNNLGGKQTINLADTALKNFEITLQTGATLSNSTASYEIDGVSVGTSRMVNASGLNSVFLQSSGTGLEGTVDNFRLTSAVPEPSSMLLVALGTLAGVMRRRRS